jgi:hypothetical protein
MIKSRNRCWCIPATIATAVVASSLLLSAGGVAVASASQKTDESTTTTTAAPTTTTTAPPTTTTTAPPHGTGNDWSYWWIPTAPGLPPIIERPSTPNNEAIHWMGYLNPNPYQITPPGSPFSTDGIIDISTSIAGYYEITFSTHGRYRDISTELPVWAFQSYGSSSGDFPQCVAPSTDPNTSNHTSEGRFDVAITCVAKLKAHVAYEWVLTSKGHVELNWQFPSKLPVATLMMQLLTPSS